MDQIIEFGGVKRGLLGVSIRDFSPETAEALGIKTDVYDGALVEEVFPDSPAEEAGIEVGDIITAVDGEKVRDAGDLRTTVGLKRSGETVKVTVLRNGKTKRISATLAELDGTPELAAGDIHPGLAGAEFSNYTPGSMAYEGKGVLVSSVAQGSPAEFRGLQTNDIIAQVGQTKVESVADLQKAAEDKSVLVLKIYRGDRTLLRQIR